ncbi:MAG: type II secretion system GspH family protein [Phycisphaerae bacterium]|nr:type II secretion system GspH family protein [Phycisphaerae bacterium]
MPTSTAQMPTKSMAYYNPAASKRRFKSETKDGFTLIETIIVLGVLSLLTAFAMVNFMGKAGKSSFKREAMEIVNTLKMAQNAAAQNGRRYIVMFDFIEQKYTMKEILTLDEFFLIVEEDEGEALSETQLSERCMIEYIVFDNLKDDTRNSGDIEDQAQLKTYFVAGRSGWQNGGKIGLTDIEGNEYSIIVNRMSKSIILEEGDVDPYFLEPKKNLEF